MGGGSPSHQDRRYEPRLFQSCGHATGQQRRRLGVRPFRRASAAAQPRRPDDRWCLRWPWSLRRHRPHHLPHRAGRIGNLRRRRPADLRPRLAADTRRRHQRLGTAPALPGPPVARADHRCHRGRRPRCHHRDGGRVPPARTVRGIAHPRRRRRGDRADQSIARRAAGHRAVHAAAAVRNAAPSAFRNGANGARVSDDAVPTAVRVCAVRAHRNTPHPSTAPRTTRRRWDRRPASRRPARFTRRRRDTCHHRRSRHVRRHSSDRLRSASALSLWACCSRSTHRTRSRLVLRRFSPRRYLPSGSRSWSGRGSAGRVYSSRSARCSRSHSRSTATVDVPLRGGVGGRFYAPASASDIPAAYHLGIGRQSLDLTGLDLAGKKVQVTSSVGAGVLHVEVPSNVKVVTHGRAGAGDVLIDGNDVSGNHVDRTVVLAATAPAVAGEIDLDLRVGVGRVMVDRDFASTPETVVPTAPAEPSAPVLPTEPAVPSP